MSTRFIAWARAQRTGDVAQQCLLLLLADHADEAGHCFPSYRRLAADACVSPRTAMRKIEALVAAGLVRKAARRRPGGGDSANAYWLLAEAAELRPARKEGRSLRGVTGCVTEGAPIVSPRKEPSEETAQGRDARVFEALFMDWTARGVGTTSWAPSLAEWRQAITAGLDEVVLAAAIRKALAEGCRKALQYWLRDEDWRAFTGGRSHPAGAWSGPPAIHAAVVAAAGQGFAASWLARTRCEEAPGGLAILATTSLAADRLRRALSREAWTQLGWPRSERPKRRRREVSKAKGVRLRALFHYPERLSG